MDGKCLNAYNITGGSVVLNLDSIESGLMIPKLGSLVGRSFHAANYLIMCNGPIM